MSIRNGFVAMNSSTFKTNLSTKQMYAKGGIKWNYLGLGFEDFDKKPAAS